MVDYPQPYYDGYQAFLKKEKIIEMPMLNPAEKLFFDMGYNQAMANSIHLIAETIPDIHKRLTAMVPRVKRKKGKYQNASCIYD